MNQDTSKDWIAPLCGVAFVVIAILSFIVSGEPKSADDGPIKVVQWYKDNKDSVEIGAIMGALASMLLLFFGAYFRKILNAGRDGAEFLSLVAFAGLISVAVGIAIDSTLQFAAAEAADDNVNPIAVLSIQAVWDNDFVPLLLGVGCFLWASGISIIRSGVLPKWLGIVMLVFGVVAFTPAGFVAAIFTALLVLVLGIVLCVRARSASAPPPATTPPSPAV